MATTNVKTRSGNRVIVTFDEKRIGLVQNLRGSDDYGHEPASGIGDIHAVEYVPGMARHTITMSQMVLYVGAAREAGVTGLNGDDVLKGKVFDIVVQDREAGTVLRKYVSCSYVSGDVEVNAHRIIVANATFMALDVVGNKL